ncbi:DUF2690 domain-containing protein [Sphaerisporangium aureirubrum]|uniref:DUF2690 domain-containing protein n=1 Tax=Sphaerisporangium aureirubrum TaxID=1544736 RepID=A0ABW1NAL5_9ACTN
MESHGPVRRRRYARALGWAVAMFAVTGGVTPVISAATAEPAYAALCSGSMCTGLDPYSAGCASNAAAVRTANISNGNGTGRVELWYSYSCNANWAVTRSYSGSKSLWAGVWGRDYGTMSGQYENLSGYNWIYTNMINGSWVTCAGGDNSGGNGPQVNTACV